MHWKLLLTPPLPGPENMALDEALIGRARETGEAVFRVYSWAQPTLSFGRNQSALGAYEPGRARERGVAVVRRPTGGRSLLHHHEVTYSVTAPLATGDSLRESYARINRLLVDGLRRLGVAVQVAAPSDRALIPSASPCFERPAAGELVVGERKLVGSAQWRDDGAMLQHGSILVEDDQSLVSALARSAVPVPQPAATLAGALNRVPAVDEVATALFASVRSMECGTATELLMDATIIEAKQRLLDRYLDDRWTWRR
jgi:lipoyl(octanoyl) transferase